MLGVSQRTTARFDAAYRAELAAFVELVLGERENPCTPEGAVAASRVADAAQESLETGAPVRVQTPAPANPPDSGYGSRLGSGVPGTDLDTLSAFRVRRRTARQLLPAPPVPSRHPPG